MKKSKNTYAYRKFHLYLMVGITAFIVEYACFVGLSAITSSLILAQSLSFLGGLLVSFAGNRGITFSDKQADYALSGSSQLWRYAMLAFINLILSNLVLHGIVNWLGASPLIAKIIVMMTIVSWNYLIFNKLIFRTR